MSYQRDFEKRLNVAVVGVGTHGYRNVLPTMTFLPVHLKAFCDVNIDRARITAEQYGVKTCYDNMADMFQNEELDAIFLCVPPRLHPELTCEALDAGVHVWLEKPPGMFASEVEEMIRHRKDRVVVVGFKKAFMPATQKIIEIFGTAEYGPLRTLLGVYPMTIPSDGPSVFFANANIRIGFRMEFIHYHSCWQLVERFQAVTVHRGKRGGGVCVLEFASGALGNFHLADWCKPWATFRLYQFFGDGCHAEIRNGTRVLLQRGMRFNYSGSTSFVTEGFDSGAIVWEPQYSLGTLENKGLFRPRFLSRDAVFL